MKTRLFPMLAIAACLLSPKPAAAQGPTRCDTLYLRDGSVQYVQAVQRAGEGVLRFTPCPDGGRQMMVRQSSIKMLRMANGGRVEPPEVPGAPFEAPRPWGRDVVDAFPLPDSVRLYHIETVDGNDYVGRILLSDQKVVRMKTKSVGEISIPRENVKNMEPIGADRMHGSDFWFENPHGTRYLFAPNGYGLRRGEGYYQNTWVMFNQVSYGFTDHITVGVGLVPTFLFGESVVPFWVTPKFSIPIKKDKLNAALGVFYINALGAGEDTDFEGAGIMYGSLTLGSKDQNATFGLGYGFVEGKLSETPTASFSAMYRVSKRSFFVTENYLLPSSPTAVLMSVGGRWVAKRMSFDLALVRPFYEGSGDDFNFIGLPWLGITLPFGHKLPGK